MSTLGVISIAAWALLAWVPALLIAREYATDPNYGEGETGLVFVMTWLAAPFILPLFAAGWLTIRIGRVLEAWWDS